MLKGRALLACRFLWLALQVPALLDPEVSTLLLVCLLLELMLQLPALLNPRGACASCVCAALSRGTSCVRFFGLRAPSGLTLPCRPGLSYRRALYCRGLELDMRMCAIIPSPTSPFLVGVRGCLSGTTAVAV
jgi:hypothetical protein